MFSGVTPVQLGRHKAKLINFSKGCKAIILFIFFIILFIFFLALLAHVKEKSSLSIVVPVLVFYWIQIRINITSFAASSAKCYMPIKRLVLLRRIRA